MESSIVSTVNWNSCKVLRMYLYYLLVGLLGIFNLCESGTKNKPHPHPLRLEPYDGRHISYNITIEQNKMLSAGLPVCYNCFQILRFYVEIIYGLGNIYRAIWKIRQRNSNSRYSGSTIFVHK